MSARARKKVRFEFQCCFCGKGMQKDICAVILVLHWEKPEAKQREQQFFCHPVCFEEKTGEKIRV